MNKPKVITNPKPPKKGTRKLGKGFFSRDEWLSAPAPQLKVVK